MSRLALVTLALALILGAGLRFYNLDALQMSADEGATWAAAAAPSVRQVIVVQKTHNVGKLPLHDLLLHGWIRLFGDGVATMRSLSGVFGFITILLMVPVTLELFRIGRDGRSGGDPPQLSGAWMVAALAALVCAVSLVLIKYSREARMYGLLEAVTIVQVWFFLRMIRRRTVADFLLLAVFTAAAIATNLVVLPMFATEGLWLIFLIVTGMARREPIHAKAAIVSGVAMSAGVVILSPALYVMFRIGQQAVKRGAVNWIAPTSWWEPVALFNKATGTVAFPFLFAIAAWGIWQAAIRPSARISSNAREAVGFTLLWMWGPPILLEIGSLVWRPMFIERYTIYCFPGFFVLIALGIWELGSNTSRAGATVLMIALSLGHVYSFSRKSHDLDWRGAAQVAASSLRPDQTLAVMPRYAVEVVRYYMPPLARPYARPYDEANANSAVVVITDVLANQPAALKARARHAHLLGHPRGVYVFSR